jgi:formate hydrogenlyase subunit 6/NADH:ubiquinone oxidoreductase subunit I
VNPNKPSMHDDYTLTTVDPNWLQERIKPRRHIALSPELCILCRACEDVCPWDCIYMLAPDIVKDGESPQEVTTLPHRGAVVCPRGREQGGQQDVAARQG